MKNTGNEHSDNSYRVEINGSVYQVSFEEGSCIAWINDEPVELDIRLEREPDLYSVLLDGKSVMLSIEQDSDPGTYHVHAGGYDFQTDVVTSHEAFLRDFIRAADAGKKESRVTAPMPGLIIKYIVEEGSQVQRGQGIMIMEAMKMENEIKAPVAGTVHKFYVEEGEAVEKGHVLFEIK